MKKIFKIILYLSIALLFFAGGIFVAYKKYEPELSKSKREIKELRQKIKFLQNIIKEKDALIEKNSLPSEALDYACSTIHQQQKPIVPPPTRHQKTSKKPKLVIIIDDMAFKYEANLLKQIPLKITPSFFPPTSIHPNTPKLAREFSHYMIHMPMQAFHFNRPESDTLKVTDSYNKILNQIKETKKLFPKAKFINNHTGSKFTSNIEAMNKLFKALKKEHLNFVDSRTASSTKSKIVNKKYHLTLYQRDIFLDNERSPLYILDQLKKAVKIAQEKGYAIAIGHPYKVTLETLKRAKPILKNVKVVYIDELAKN